MRPCAVRLRRCSNSSPPLSSAAHWRLHVWCLSICVVRAVGFQGSWAQLDHSLIRMAIDPLSVEIIEINPLRQEHSDALAMAPYFSWAIFFGELVNRVIKDRSFFVPNEHWRKTPRAEKNSNGQEISCRQRTISGNAQKMAFGSRMRHSPLSSQQCHSLLEQWASNCTVYSHGLGQKIMMMSTLLW